VAATYPHPGHRAAADTAAPLPQKHKVSVCCVACLGNAFESKEIHVTDPFGKSYDGFELFLNALSFCVFVGRLTPFNKRPSI
jgi:hypothetical protein